MRHLIKPHLLFLALALAMTLLILGKWMTPTATPTSDFKAAHQVLVSDHQLANGLNVSLVQSSSQHGAWHWHQVHLDDSPELNDSLKSLSLRAHMLGGELQIWPGQNNQSLSFSFNQQHGHEAIAALDQFASQHPRTIGARNHLVIVSDELPDSLLTLLPESLAQLPANQATAQDWQHSPNQSRVQLHLPISLTASEQSFIWWWLARADQPSHAWIRTTSLFWSTRDQWHLQWQSQGRGKPVDNLLQSLINLEAHLDAALQDYRRLQPLCPQTLQAHDAVHQAILITQTGSNWRELHCQTPSAQTLRAKINQIQPQQIRVSASTDLDISISTVAPQPYQPLDVLPAAPLLALTAKSTPLLRVQPQLIQHHPSYQLWYSQDEFATNDLSQVFLAWSLHNEQQQQTAWWLQQVLSQQSLALRQSLARLGASLTSQFTHGHFSLELSAPSSSIVQAHQLLYQHLNSDQIISDWRLHGADDDLTIIDWLAFDRQQPRTLAPLSAIDWQQRLIDWQQHSPLKQLWFADLPPSQVTRQAELWQHDLEPNEHGDRYPSQPNLSSAWFHAENHETNRLAFWQFSDNLEQSINRELLFELMQTRLNQQWQQQGLDSRARTVHGQQQTGLIIEGNQAPHLMELRLQRFVEQYWQELQDMPSRQYSSLQQGLSLAQEKQPWSSEARAQNYWLSLLVGDEHYLGDVRRAQQILLISKDSLVRHLGSLRTVENTGLWLHQGTGNLSQHRNNRRPLDTPESLSAIR